MRLTHAGTFHVTARSVAEEHIFKDAQHYGKGVAILSDLVRAKFLECHQFCFMPTHYHFVGTFGDDMLTPAIRRFNRRYAGWFNWRHSRRGRVFDAPFVSVEVTTEQHADRLPEYLAENPPHRPWRWSSVDHAYPFITPLPWREELESGSATPNQIRTLQ